jgi:hypothetical protein
MSRVVLLVSVGAQVPHYELCKTVQNLHTTYAHPLVYFKPFLDYYNV